MLNWFFNLPIILEIFIFYLLAINIVSFFYFGIDKINSTIQNKKRISEKKLWFLTLIGGSFGSLIGMNFFRHKTKKMSFQTIIALILTLQILLIYFLFLRHG